MVVKSTMVDTGQENKHQNHQVTKYCWSDLAELCVLKQTDHLKADTTGY